VPPEKSIAQTVLSGLPTICCAHCAHGLPYLEQSNLKTMVVCKAVPPSVIVIKTPEGEGIQSRFPQMDEGNYCGLFVPKPAT
jgi:hypothetical protein